METQDSATNTRPVAVSGLLWAGAGVVAFSGTVPATIFALRGFDPLVVGAGRTVIAAVVAGAWLLAGRRALPARRNLPQFLMVAAGCGIGFGVLSAIAFHQISGSHAAVVIGLMPISTAAASVVLGGERPRPLFWLASGAGAAVVVAYAMSEGAGTLRGADVLLLVALALGAFGYASGAQLAREIPGSEVVAWGIVLALPVALPIALVALHGGAIHPGWTPLAGLAYVSVISMFLGFIPWYRGLATAGTARASQTQLLQPFLSIGWAMLLLGERPGAPALVAALLVGVCMVSSVRTRSAGRPMSAQPRQSSEVPAGSGTIATA